ncbi:uncharacterized protein TNCV_2469621 [Trichonephila clavipes]|nr:uncharacterized protein TNCV_2469621 [Trichonephila clavipes]
MYLVSVKLAPRVRVHPPQCRGCGDVHYTTVHAQAVLEAKREEFVDDALTYTKSFSEELEISFEHPGGNIYLATEVKMFSYRTKMRRTMFSSIDRVTAAIRERFQQLQNLAQKYAFLRPEVILSMDELRSSSSRH